MEKQDVGVGDNCSRGRDYVPLRTLYIIHEIPFLLCKCSTNSNWVLISQWEKKIFQDVFLILKAFHFTSLKSVSIATLFIHTVPIKWLHLVDCFGWLWPWFDFKSKFHFSFLMSEIKLSGICPTQRTDRSFFSIISCSLVLKKSLSLREWCCLCKLFEKLKDLCVSCNNNTNGKHHG